MHQKKYILVILGCMMCFALFHSYTSETLLNSTTEETTCESYLHSMTEITRIDGILIDTDFLVKLDEKMEKCGTGPLKIAVKSGELNKWNNTTGLTLIPYKDDPGKDYWLFFDNGTDRAVQRIPLRMIGKLMAPKQPLRFIEYWRRSPLLNCLNIKMNRRPAISFLPIPYTFSQMAKLRDLLVEYDMYPFIIGGTMLGWYRECGLIPHTMDVDFAVFSNQMNPKFEDNVLQNKTEFNLRRRLGAISDSFEYTLAPKTETRPAIDIFFMYQERNESWVGGTGGGGRKFRYYYPRYNPYCSADLGGYLFWVTCSPEIMLKADYGIDWKKDWPTRNYGWSSSGKNIRSAGMWKPGQLKDVYRTY